MRGKEIKEGYENRAKGITPAYAGKRQDVRQRRKKEKDHPRLCGEKKMNEKENA